MRALILGATSPVGRHLALVLAARGADLVLASRDQEELERQRSHLAVCAPDVRVEVEPGDVTTADFQRALVTKLAPEGHEPIDTVFSLVGDLGDNEAATEDSSEFRRITEVNYTGVATVLTAMVPHFRTLARGNIVVVSSVAGDRGRQSNYPYGAAKAALSAFAAGLRNRMYQVGVHVLTVKPGFIDTATTWGLPGLFAVAKPEEVARGIVRAMDRRKNVVYLPGFWRWIMCVICAVPEVVFKRLKL